MNMPKPNVAITPMRGFSLIELMIVLAIIAILALAAMPGQTARSLQANRAQVAEGQMFMSSAKMGARMYMQDTDECPDNSDEDALEELEGTGIALATAYSGQYVNSVELGGEMDEDGGCTITATFKPTQAHAVLRGKTLTMQLFDVLSGVPKWACFTDVDPQRYVIMPKECRYPDLESAKEALMPEALPESPTTTPS